EYPLSLDPAEAETCIQLARQRGKLLHVEHIELLGGWHQTLKQHLPHLEPVTFLRYATVTPQNPAPCKWTYHRELFGFPLSGALSRLHRLTDALGSVATVSCQQRYWEAPEPGYYRACLVTAQVQFANGAIAEVVYGKGETLWHPLRTMEVHGEQGTLLFEGDRATLIQGETQTPLDMDGRRGLFAKDMQMAIDHLVEGKPLYVQPEASLYALRVADAARRSAEMEGAICVP
ncbi:Gfo/Idh/MocA family oxidoreductase, partial [bacterium]|nr:Gfo/Idh/MocA family oxidoreductase [bacterium]